MNRNLVGSIYGRSSIQIAYFVWTDSSYQVLDDLAKQFQRRRFLEIDQLEIRIAWGDLVFLMDPDEISNLYRLVHFKTIFSAETALPNDQKLGSKHLHCMEGWIAWGDLVFLMDPDEISNLYRGSPIDASYQVSWNLVGSICGRSSIKIAHFVLIH
jgi:hypothetical protein